MPEELVYYVTRYGYLAILILVFLQEIGMPNPFPNELLLLFSGYLSFKGLLFLPFIILTALSADFVGTSLLYFLFYKTGTAIIQKKPKWIPISISMINRLSSKISSGGLFSIYIFRLTPFTRGYTSVITGLIQVKPRVFLPIAFISALTWASVYVLTGHLIGPFWNIFVKNIGDFKYIMVTVLVILLCIVLLRLFYRKIFNYK
jgi:membrane protein DedA with SNARE-associated domain